MVSYVIFFWGGSPQDPLAVMDWDGDLVTILLGVNYVPPCLCLVLPCCFEAGYGPVQDSDLTWTSANCAAEDWI